MFKLQNAFLKINKYIGPNCEMYLIYHDSLQSSGISWCLGIIDDCRAIIIWWQSLVRIIWWQSWMTSPALASWLSFADCVFSYWWRVTWAPGHFPIDTTSSIMISVYDQGKSLRKNIAGDPRYHSIWIWIMKPLYKIWGNSTYL